MWQFEAATAEVSWQIKTGIRLLSSCQFSFCRQIESETRTSVFVCVVCKPCCCA